MYVSRARLGDRTESRPRPVAVRAGTVTAAGTDATTPESGDGRDAPGAFGDDRPAIRVGQTVGVGTLADGVSKP